jgi:glycosyltransferase involved in cell wall biosynthesis
MMSSIEYLLAGLPVVSTRSLGGRDVFFDEANSLIVGDSPDAVAAAVRELAARALDPASIRDQTLQRMKPHRERLIELIETLCELAGRRCEFRTRWDEIFAHHMCGKNEPQDRILRQLAASGY